MTLHVFGTPFCTGVSALTVLYGELTYTQRYTRCSWVTSRQTLTLNLNVFKTPFWTGISALTVLYGGLSYTESYARCSLGTSRRRGASAHTPPGFGGRDWYVIAEQPAPAHPEGCAAPGIVLVTVPLLPAFSEAGVTLHALAVTERYTRCSWVTSRHRGCMHPAVREGVPGDACLRNPNGGGGLFVDSQTRPLHANEGYQTTRKVASP